MLELERLNGESFDEIVERAVNIAERFGGEWNNFQAADPGMTLLDLFAWLKALQHEYMSVILPESQRRFLSLLDIRQRRGRGAETVAVLSGAEEDTVIPAGTKWLAGDMVFENRSPATALAARLTEVRFQGGGQELHCLPSMFDGNRFFENLVGGQQGADAGVGVLHVVHRVVAVLPHGQVQVEVQGTGGGAVVEVVPGRVYRNLIQQVGEGDGLAGAL